MEISVKSSFTKETIDNLAKKLDKLGITYTRTEKLYKSYRGMVKKRLIFGLQFELSLKTIEAIDEIT